MLLRARALPATGRCVAVRRRPMSCGRFAQQQIEREQQHGGDDRERPRQAARQPSRAITICSHGSSVIEPRPTPKTRCRARARAAARTSSDEMRLHAVAEEVRAGADHDAERRVDLPRLARDRREAEPAHDHRDTDLDHQHGALAVHQAADERRDEGRDEEIRTRRCRPRPPRSNWNSFSTSGNSSENAVRALMPTAIVTKAAATMIQP
jgi:hypothetical protein